MKEKMYQSLIELTNSLPVSELLMKFSKSKISRFAIPSYVKHYKINTDEIEGDIKSYSSLHHFFTRKLKADARHFEVDENTILSPVDGVIEQLGDISMQNNIVVKNQTYSIKGMIGNERAFHKYVGGKFIVLYLSPSDYHRIHSPIKGKIVNQYSLGTASYPVNETGLSFGKTPLTTNYRVVSEMKHSEGDHVAIVKVGAMFVNSIELTQTSKFLNKGEELAYFSFGSTVVLLFEKGSVEFPEELYDKHQIKAGEVLALKN
ncbi:phosphatidylserine decarboxylase [Priestia megaterium]|uniref:phosphatidylserine decarboxylase n=1 Tax=Priestia megaterium TaxID=1404 RepID=UPI002E1A505F|nr:phosphatidylserine decarboxylase [Priestia megaterium]MED4284892.1 phosphatidylserine decarboxylase [Priestia megaterium]